MGLLLGQLMGLLMSERALSGAGRCTLVLQRGEGVLLRSDVWHAGAAYLFEHWRAHYYLQPISLMDLELRSVGESTVTSLFCFEHPSVYAAEAAWSAADAWPVERGLPRAADLSQLEVCLKKVCM